MTSKVYILYDTIYLTFFKVKKITEMDYRLWVEKVREVRREKAVVIKAQHKGYL